MMTTKPEAREKLKQRADEMKKVNQQIIAFIRGLGVDLPEETVHIELSVNYQRWPQMIVKCLDVNDPAKEVETIGGPVLKTLNLKTIRIDMQPIEVLQLMDILNDVER